MYTSNLKVTVALVCYQEKEKLAHVLKDLKNQTVFDNIGEVLIFQNGTCKQTSKTAESFLEKLPLKIFSSSSNNLGLARAKLVEKSLYDLIVFTDSDCSLPENWLEELLSHWKNKEPNDVVAIGGPNLLPEKRWWQKMVNLSLCHPLGHGWSPQAWKVKKKTKVSHIPTTNGLFLKQAVLSVGNFSEQYKFAGEDLDLGLRLKRKGHLILFPSPTVTNNYAKTYFESLKRLFIFGKIRGIHISFLFYPSFLFFPLFTFFLILGFFQKNFLLLPALYLLFLFLASLFEGLKNKKSASLLLPLFWFLQHLSYSMGTSLGTFFKNLNRLSGKKLKN